jgi:AcrR family transcriptional regulator
VTDESALDTRARILRAAMDLFGEQGYQRTSIREIGQRLGLTKTAVLYHFPSKPQLLAAVAEPMLVDLERTLTEIDESDPVVARWAVVERVLDVWFAHRQLLRASLQDLSILSHLPVFQRFRDALLTAQRLVAGPNPDFAGQVRAIQVIATLSDPLMLLVDAPPAVLRREILAGAGLLLAASPPPPPPHPKPRGRPTTMRPDMVTVARRLHAEGETADQISVALGVSRATVYRHLSH